MLRTTPCEMLDKKISLNIRISKVFSVNRRGFRLPQRSHLRTLKTFVSEKLGKYCEKIGETLDKIRKPENFEEVHIFPVSAPGKVFPNLRYIHVNKDYVSIYSFLDQYVALPCGIQYMLLLANNLLMKKKQKQKKTEASYSLY